MATARETCKGSDEYIDVKCSICAKKKTEQIADYYCYDCRKHLCSSCLGTHNEFNENHNVVQGHGDAKDVLTERCLKHVDELITLYCRQHNELLCRKCHLLEHSIPASAGCSTQECSSATLKAHSLKSFSSLINEVRTIIARIPEDKEVCGIYDCCPLSDGSLIIADVNNKKLKRVDPSSRTVMQYCDTDKEPCNVCCIGPKEIAVAFYGSTQVQVYNTESLTRTRTVELEHGTARIAYHGGLLYCTGWPGTLYVHDVRSGRKLREISKDTDGRELFSNIRHIAVNSSGDRLYVADGMRGLVCVGVDGRRILCLSDKDLGLSGATGVTTDHHGHVFVCGAKSKNVVKVTDNSHVVGEILSEEDGITWRPFCLSYDVNRSRLYVGGENSDQLLVEEWK